MKNFWMDAEAQGRKTHATCGTTGAGDMTINLYQRFNGMSVKVMEVNCYVEDGTLITMIYITDETGKQTTVKVESER